MPCTLPMLLLNLLFDWSAFTLLVLSGYQYNQVILMNITGNAHVMLCISIGGAAIR